ncbi:hypothetical protein Goshw_004356 [Gossypium schwendimanii]|uniref:Uncharacterized protein n=1 Tax=Gossypium schwendimanii TaxID=34291 RepID=A0A7J9KQ08_GOSSC|nr:hypothetical protein [Gossypium schwendimanii]
MGYGVIARYEEGFVVGGCRGYKNMEETCRKLEMFVLADVMMTPRSSNRLDDFMCKFV